MTTVVKRTKKVVKAPKAVKAVSTAPKRPNSAYILFMNENRAKFKAENPNATFGELSRIGGQQWASVKPVVKAKYEKLAQIDRERYERESASYVPTEADKQLKKAKKAKKVRDPTLPKKNLNAYMFYANSNRDKLKKQQPSLSATEIVSQLGSQWRALSDREKKQYNDMAAKDKVRYQNAIAK